MARRDYTQFDAAIIERIKCCDGQFNSIKAGEEVGSMMREIAKDEGKSRHEEFRPLDRRLQALRKQGKIISVKGRLGPEWRVLEVKQ